MGKNPSFRKVILYGTVHGIWVKNCLKLWIQGSRLYCVFIIIMYSSSVPHFIANSFSNYFQLLLKPGNFTVLKGQSHKICYLHFLFTKHPQFFLYITFFCGLRLILEGQSKQDHIGYITQKNHLLFLWRELFLANTCSI